MVVVEKVVVMVVVVMVVVVMVVVVVVMVIVAVGLGEDVVRIAPDASSRDARGRA